MRSLKFRIMISFVLVALLSVGIVAYLANQSAKSRFADYLQGEQPRQGMMGPGPHMGRMMGMAEQQFLKNLNVSLWTAAAWTIIAAIGAAFLLTRNIIVPIRRLSQAAEHMRNGEYQQKVEFSSQDELAELAQSFNTMADRLKQNEEQRRRWLAAVAHELRTPLTIIQGNLEGMIDGVVPASHAQLQSLHEESLRLQRLVSDVRELALAEAKQLSLRKARTNVNELLTQSTQSLLLEAAKYNVTLSVEQSETIYYADIDMGRIRQVLENLLTNAIRHSHPGGNVRVTCKEQAGKLVIAVADDGLGISTDALPFVFEYFFRADSSRSRGSGGSGLGLAVARQIVEAHDGSIGVDSIEGKGSVFTFTLPYQKEGGTQYE